MSNVWENNPHSESLYVSPMISRKEKEEDSKVAHLMHFMVLELVGCRWVVASRFAVTFPLACAALLDEDPERVTIALTKMKLWWERLQSLDKQALSSSVAAKFRASLLWPLWDWPRTVLIVLSEHNFQKVPPTCDLDLVVFQLFCLSLKSQKGSCPGVLHAGHAVLTQQQREPSPWL